MSNVTTLLRAIVTVAPAMSVLGSLFVVTGPATLWIAAVFVCMAAIMLADSNPSRAGKRHAEIQNRATPPRAPHRARQTPCHLSGQ